jgi:hypothetical protein
MRPCRTTCGCANTPCRVGLFRVWRCRALGDNARVSYILFDDAGKFLAGRVMSEAEASMQVELDSGKRVKVKAANAMLRFEQPAPAALIAQAQALAGEIDLDLAWEFAPEDEFGFGDLAREYFSASAGPAQQAAALFRLFDSPHYFRRLGKGRFRKAPEETVKAALLAIERKQQSPRRSRPGPANWRPASAPRRCASSSTASCSSPTRTRPSTRPWSRPPGAASAHRWTC